MIDIAFIQNTIILEMCLGEKRTDLYQINFPFPNHKCFWVGTDIDVFEDSLIWLLVNLPTFLRMFWSENYYLRLILSTILCLS